MKRFLILFTFVSLFVSCRKNEFVLFDTPFVYITDESGMLTQMEISKNANNLLTELAVHLDVSDTYYTGPIQVEYELLCGNGMVENVDFRLNPQTASPLVFENKNYTLPIQISWMKNPDFDENKDNYLIVNLKSSSLPEMKLGVPGPNESKRIFTFIKTTL